MNRLVYSTENGRLCPDCSRAIVDCRCKQQRGSHSSGDGIVRIHRETKGRKGKGVSIITGLPLNADELKKLAREIKQRCSSGGSVKDNTIEIQGDQRPLIQTLLQAKGYTVKLSGA